jgi:hypothetical protein
LNFDGDKVLPPLVKAGKLSFVLFSFYDEAQLRQPMAVVPE